MKLMLCSLAICLPLFLMTASGQDNPQSELLRIPAVNPQGNHVMVAALHIERDAPTLKWAPSVIHLRGNVEIRTSMNRVQSDWETEGQAKPQPDRMYMVLHCDEAEYHEDTGGSEPRGHVRVTFEKPK